MINNELLSVKELLLTRITQERNEINKLKHMLLKRGQVEKVKPIERPRSPNEAELTAMKQLTKENQLLEVSF